jgi:hypoxanthine phosphoribosyltransferase
MEKFKQEPKPESPKQEKEEFKYRILDYGEARETLKEKIKELIDLVQAENIDYLVFLDKSARPFSWLFRDMWDKVAEKDAKRPEIRFANIGRSISFAHEKQQNKERDVESEETLASDVGQLKQNFKNQFDDKSVLIVDDISATGGTRQLAEKEFRMAFPNTSINFKTLYTYASADDIPWLLKAGYQGVVEAEDSVFANALTKENIKKIQGKLDGQLDTTINRLLEKIHDNSDLISLIKQLEDTMRSTLQHKDINVIEEDLMIYSSDITDKLKIIEKLKTPISENSTTEEKRNYFESFNELIPVLDEYLVYKFNRISLSEREIKDYIDLFSFNFFDVTKKISADKKIFENYDKLRKKFLQLRKELKHLAEE